MYKYWKMVQLVRKTQHQITAKVSSLARYSGIQQQQRGYIISSHSLATENDHAKQAVNSH